MKVLALISLLLASPALASLYCATEVQGTPTEIANRTLPTVPMQEVQVDLMETGWVQIDVRDHYGENSAVVRARWQPQAGLAVSRIAGVAFGEYRDEEDQFTVARVGINERGRLVLTVRTPESEQPFALACEIPGDYRPSYFDAVRTE